MALVVWKYHIFLGYPVVLAMPEGARVLYVREQFDMPTLWAMADPDAPIVERRFVAVGTGEHIPDGFMQHIGSCFTNESQFVWHIFESPIPSSAASSPGER